jgi:hypothetical protein
MMIRRFGLFTVIAALTLTIGCAAEEDTSSSTEAAAAEPDSALQATVQREIESLNAMRSDLAQTISTDESVDQATFARVCKPVGKRAKEMAAEHDWVVRQIAERYRNPAHQLDDRARPIFERFEQNPEVVRLWTRTERDGTEGWRYFRRITVETSCLACHGAEADRPDFVKANYPEDKAYGFEAGDLRGLYSVFVPDSVR